MAGLTDALVERIDARIIENFADIFELEAELVRIAKKHDLAEPAVIAALGVYADVPNVQKRLVEQPPVALVKGLTIASKRTLRPPAKLMVEALLDGARREAGQRTMATPKKLPAFARPTRLPAPVDAEGTAATVEEIEALVRAIAAAAPGEAPETEYTAASLAELGRALALGWLSHGAEPKHAWGAHAAGLYPDDATAHDLGMMARELGPRVGQFSKAQVLVDVLAAMNTRAALAVLHELATKVATRSVRDRAQAAFEAAARRSGMSQHDLADKLMPDGEPLGRDFVQRLERRMVERTAIPLHEFVENILQRDATHGRLRGILFAAETGKGRVLFTIGDDGRLVDEDGALARVAKTANVIVVHPIELTAGELAAWRPKLAKPAFAQLDRPVEQLASARALATHLTRLLVGNREHSEGGLRGLERQGWKRGAVVSGRFSTLTRELDGITATLEFDPGIYAGGGMALGQRITKIRVQGKGSPRALSEIAREATRATL